MQNKVDGIAIGMGTTLIPVVNEFLKVIENAGAGAGRFIDQQLAPLADELARTGELLNLNLSVDQVDFWDAFFSPLTKPIEAATAAFKFFNEVYENFLRLTGQPIPGTPVIDPMTDKYGGGVRGSVQLGTGGMGAAPAATTNNIFIGTQKVDTVITNSINRTGTFKRGR
jgi:hypothetical protein